MDGGGMKPRFLTSTLGDDDGMSPMDAAKGTLDKVVEWLGRRESGTVVSVLMLSAVCYGIFWAGPILLQQHREIIAMVEDHDATQRDVTRKYFADLLEVERTSHLKAITQVSESFVQVMEMMRQERALLVEQLKSKKE